MEKSSLQLINDDEFNTSKKQTARTPYFYSIQVYEEFQYIEDLFSYNNIILHLASSPVFIHKKKTWSDNLINIVSKLIGEYIDIEIIKTHDKKFNKFISYSDVTGKSNKKLIILDITKSVKNLEHIITTLLIKGINNLWLTSTLSDIDSKVLSFFDTFFIYDMPSSEFDTLKSAIPISNVIIENMEENTDSTYARNLLVYIDTNKIIGLPPLDKNPFVTTQGTKEIEMIDITLDIIDATKLLFETIRKIRKTPDNSQIENEDYLTKKTFYEYYDNNKLKEIINEAYAKKHLRTIQSITKQIYTHIQNLNDLNEKKAEFGAYMPPHFNREIDRQTEELNNKSKELESMLSDIYGKEIKL